ASIGPQVNFGGRGGQQAGAAGGAGTTGGTGAGGDPGTAGAPGRAGGPLPVPDFTTPERLDKPIPPNITAADAFFEFLFSQAPTKYDELKRKAAAQEGLPAFRLDGVKLTFNIDADYQVVRTQLAQNVVAVVEGSDAQLK